MDLKALRLQKSYANLQRRWRESYLAAIRPDLADFLGGRPFLTAPETDALASRFGLPDSEDAPGDHEYAEFHHPGEVLREISALPASEAPAWLMPVGYSRPVGPDHCAAFQVPFAWGQRHADALWTEGEWGRPGFNLVTEDGGVGVLIDNWVAEPEDASPTGTVYAVRKWSVS